MSKVKGIYGRMSRKSFPLYGIRFSRILEKLQKSKIFYFSGEYWMKERMGRCAEGMPLARR